MLGLKTKTHNSLFHLRFLTVKLQSQAPFLSLALGLIFSAEKWPNLFNRTGKSVSTQPFYNLVVWMVKLNGNYALE